MDLVLDTSVVVKWFVRAPEGDLEAALEIRRRFVGAVYVLRYQPQLGVEEVASALDSLETMDLDVRPFSYPLGKGAVQLAKATGITAYDAYFIGSSGNRVGSWKDVRGSQGNPLLCKEGGGEVEILLAHTNHGSPREEQPLDASTPPGLPLQRGGT